MKTIIIFVLCSITALVIGCSERKADANVEVTNACLGSETIINESNFQFAADVTTCSQSSWGDFQSTSSCLQKKYPTLNTQCVQCFGSLAQCGLANCKIKCMFDNISSECINCGTQNCRCTTDSQGKATSFSLIQCTGIAMENQPVKTSANMNDLVLNCLNK